MTKGTISFTSGSFLAFLRCAAAAVSLTVGSSVYAQDTQSADSAVIKPRLVSLDVKETDIRDVIRMISKGYDLSIILDKDVAGKVTLHLSDVPIMEGLQSLADAHGLEVVKDGSVYRIRKATDAKRINILFHRGLLTADVQNIDVISFIEEVASKSGVSIVPDSRIEGRVSGKLYKVPVEDGIRALLEANGFKVLKRRNIFRVKQEEEDGAAPRRVSRRSSKPGEFYVDYQDGFLSVDVMGANLSEVLESIAEQGEIEIVTYGVISDVVNAKLNDVPLTEAFALLLGGTKFTFIQKDNVLLIGDRNTATPSGQALSTSELLHLRHIKADDVPKILPKNIPAANVKVVKEQNALLVSGTSEDIVKTREFLDKIDIPTPQVIIDVVVVEYQRDLSQDFGIEAGYDPSGTRGGNSYYFPHLQYNRKGQLARDMLGEVFDLATIAQLPDEFFISIRALESEGKAKVLAQPSITVLNGNKATMNVGQTSYYRIIAGTSDYPTYRFQPISFGIKLDITPWISRSGQITAVISPEISNSMGVNAEGYPDVFTRSVTTTVRLEDSQTLILGGLLRSEEQQEHLQVPILSKIPILGYLFKTTIRSKVQTNLVLYITPHIVGDNSGIDLKEELQRFDEKERKGFRDQLFDDAHSKWGNNTGTESSDSLASDSVIEVGDESPQGAAGTIGGPNFVPPARTEGSESSHRDVEKKGVPAADERSGNLFRRIRGTRTGDDYEVSDDDDYDMQNDSKKDSPSDTD